MSDHPTIEAEEPTPAGRRLVATWGSMNGGPTLALFVGQDENPILLPRSFLEACLASYGASN